MLQGQPSRTAFAAAAHRAAHQLLEGGRVFRDPLALPILGTAAAQVKAEAEAHPERRRMRLFIAMRSRFAEDTCNAALQAGLRQVVVLGAGLDTYACRAALPEGARVFEVDHPATQAWKRERLAAAGIALPDTLRFAAVDFEHDALADGLTRAGFDAALPAFFMWLGVVPYLREPAVWATLQLVASLPGGTQVVMDYANPPEALSGEQREQVDASAARVAELGEPWLCFFDTTALHAQLQALGFTQVEDLGPAAMVRRFLAPAVAAAGGGKYGEQGGHLLRARKA